MRHQFKDWISLRSAEEFLGIAYEAANGDRELQLGFSGVRGMDSGSGWRIGNALANFREGSGSLTVDIDMNQLGSSVSSGSWFNLIVRSGVGMGMLAYADTITSNGVNVTEDVKSYVDKALFGVRSSSGRRGYVGDTEIDGISESVKDIQISQNSVVVRNLRSPRVNLTTPERFYHTHVFPFWKFVNVKSGDFGNNDMACIIDVCLEACRNVVDHSDKDPGGENIEVVSYLGLKYYKALSASELTVGGVREYLDGLNLLRGEDLADISFLEILVSDDGVGIASRYSGSSGIYIGDKLSEEGQIRSALTSGLSAKPRTRDVANTLARGYGYLRIHSALRALNAYAVLRTGRHVAYFNGAVGDDRLFKISRDEVLYMPGTTLSILLPLLSRTKRIQTSLSLGME